MEKVQKEKVFDNLFNVAYEPVVVGKKTEMGNGVKKFFSTISSALNNVDEQIMVKVNPGVYNENLEIKKKNVKIQAIEISENSIIINSESPTIFVDMPNKEDKIFLESLKLVNTCDSNVRHEALNGGYESIKKQDYMGIETKPEMNTCIYIKKGVVQLDECKISMATSNNKEVTFPCIVVEKEGFLILNRTEIRGGDGTIGVLSKGGTVIMKESILKDHGVAGFLSTTKEKDCNISIKNSSFIKCNEGIVLNGPFVAALENNVISEAREVGIVVYNGAKSKIFNNEIKYCKNGVEVKNSYPLFLKNYILNSSEWGVKVKSSRGLMCKPMFKFNTVNENTEGGFLIEGSLNRSNIYNNELNFNNNFGIKIVNRASPHIFLNKVIKTLGNGIHAEKDCCIFLEKNEIVGSLKCNVVLEGPNNINTFVFRNIISKARAEGIFCMFGEKYTIKDNEITENYNGIVSLTGVQNIEENTIKGNSHNGILLIRDNNVNIRENEIEDNKKSGIFIRDSSVGKIENNYFSKNNIELVIENNDHIFDKIEEENEFDDDYDLRIPKNYRCSIM